MKPSLLQRTATFFAERFPKEKLSYRAMVTDKEVPVHKWSWAYYLGGLSLFFFLIQLTTGLMLLFYYEPSVSEAHESVEYITRHVAGGALIRNVHAWSSSAMILCVMAHFITTFAMKAFAKPRELTWLSGLAMMLLVFTFGFTGYLLPWNQIAVNATKIGLQSVEQSMALVPGLEDTAVSVRETIQGGPAVGQATLSRFYAIHVVVLPLITFALLGIHLLGVQMHGMSKGVDKPTGKKERFFPFFVIKDLSVWGITFLILIILALCIPFEAFFDYPLFAPYDPLGSTPDGIKPEWYFYFVYYPLEMLPLWFIILAQTVALGVLVAAPRLFKGTSRRVLTVIAAVISVYLFVITIFGAEIYAIVSGGH